MNHVAYFCLALILQRCLIERERLKRVRSLVVNKGTEKPCHKKKIKKKQAELSIPWFQVKCQDVFLLKS